MLVVPLVNAWGCWGLWWLGGSFVEVPNGVEELRLAFLLIEALHEEAEQLTMGGQATQPPVTLANGTPTRAHDQAASSTSVKSTSFSRGSN
jgi:hypothetical protein